MIKFGFIFRNSFYLCLGFHLIKKRKIMKKVALIYSPKGGSVEKVSKIIYGKFMPDQIVRMAASEVDKQVLIDSDFWLVGGSTAGSHVWEDADDDNMWHAFFSLLDSIDMKSKKVAFFGLGDQILYPHHYVDGLGTFQEEFSARNANIVGKWPDKGYEYSDSEGIDGDMFFGLALDEDNQTNLTESRIDKWLKEIKKEFDLS